MLITLVLILVSGGMAVAVYVAVNARKQLALKNTLAALNQHAIVVTTDAQGRMTSVNDKFCEISGYSREELLGQDHHMLNSGHHPAGFFQAMYQVLASGRVWQAEVCNRAKDGRLYWVHTTITPFMGSTGLPTMYVVIRTDITAAKHKDAELAQHRDHLQHLVQQQTARLQRSMEATHAANQAKSRFLANMSHEIRTPMNGVIGMIDILQETGLRPEQQRMLQTIHNSSLSLLNILNDILDFSKIEAGKLTVERMATPLRELVEEVVLLMLPVAGARATQIHLRVDPALPLCIFSDPNRLRQILLNLLGNALKFVAPGVGRVALEVRPLPDIDGSARLQFSICDNGMGMSEAVVAQLFQPFTQADASTARRFGGTGLGLSITQGLVGMMQGQIAVRSTPGEGSEFTVAFALEAAPLPAGHVPYLAPDLTGVRVLAVTASAACSELLQAYLASAGARVSVVADEPLALQHLQNPQYAAPAVVLLERADLAAGLPALAGWPVQVPLVCLSPRQPGGAALRAGQIATQPLLYRDLLDGVAVACGLLCLVREPAKPPGDGSVASPAPSVAEALAGQQLILMAEDNETNREVMLAQVRLLGYQAEVAEDGLQALAMWRSGRYALLLTDGHMPRMDGFELTQAIRQAEPQGTRLPIIAVTANAMQGEAERCLACGMDDFLSKPLRLKALRQALHKWLPQSPGRSQGQADLPIQADSAHADEPAPPGSTAPAVWHASTLSELVGDNPATHRRLLARFLDNAHTQVDAMEAAANAGDLQALAGVAHTLKSAARSVGALALGALCESLERAGRAGDTTPISHLAPQVRPSLAQAAGAIEQHVQSQLPST